MTQHLTLFFEPFDVLHFRDHKPFDAGIDVNADSVFPMPSVFYGCLRTALLGVICPDFATEGGFFRAPEPLRALLGGPDKVGALRMRGPLLARWEPGEALAPLFRTPLDVVFPEQDWKSHVLHAQILASLRLPEADGPRRWHGQLPAQGALPWATIKREKRPPDLLLTAAGAAAYLESQGGEALSFERARQVVRVKDVYQIEERVGIARDPETHAVEDRMLYTKRPFRLAEGYGFAVDVEVPHAEARAALFALEGRVLPLGGKGHRARVRVAEGALIPPALDPSATSGAKLWLLSPLPLPLRDGTRPALVVTDKAALVGGYDMAKRAPKALRRALPAGTVLHLREGQTLGALFANDDDRRMGYGTALGRGRG